MTKQLTYGEIDIAVIRSWIRFGITPNKDTFPSEISYERQFLELTLSDAIKLYKALGEKIEELWEAQP